jgi:site-specific DNA-methyltransferase (adenine-specific)
LGFGVIHTGDCLEVMATLDAESVDAIVTDPPYGLGFMGKAWDSAAAMALPPSAAALDSPLARFRTGKGPSAVAFDGRGYQGWCERWAAEALRVAKPGAYLLAFGGTRTVHRLACAIEDAGWLIRDMLVWAYASGFPKSKANLKPAWEPIVMARKPGPLRPLAIDECRIPTDDVLNAPGPNGGRTGPAWRAMEGREPSRRGEASADRRYADQPGDFAAMPGPRGGDPAGRWPSNVLLTSPIFDGDVPGVVGGGWQSGGGNPANRNVGRDERTSLGNGWHQHETGLMPTDTEGTYSRFFLIPKADRADREPVLGGLPQRELATHGARGQGPLPQQTPQAPIRRANVHPTVKPTDLMRHLVRLVTPPGGLVLDPFLGSGTTALACEMEGFAWLGIEREAEYVAIAEARLNGTQKGLGLTG